MIDSLSNYKPLGWVWEGHTFLFGEGEVSIERFNEVVGGDLGHGWSLSFEPTVTISFEREAVEDHWFDDEGLENHWLEGEGHQNGEPLE